jgi:SOS response regulatory protein OraA/RecX
MKMVRTRVSDEEIRQKLDQLGNTALEALRRRGTPEAEIQKLLTKKSRKPKRSDKAP